MAAPIQINDLVLTSEMASGCSSVGRACACQAQGRRFETDHPLQKPQRNQKPRDIAEWGCQIPCLCRSGVGTIPIELRLRVFDCGHAAVVICRQNDIPSFSLLTTTSQKWIAPLAVENLSFTDPILLPIRGVSSGIPISILASFCHSAATIRRSDFIGREANLYIGIIAVHREKGRQQILPYLNRPCEKDSRINNHRRRESQRGVLTNPEIEVTLRQGATGKRQDLLYSIRTTRHRALALANPTLISNSS